MLKKEEFENSLREKKIPVLTLDNKWHQLFAKVSDSDEMETQQVQLNELIKKQGKYNTELKELRKIKSRLLNELVEIRDDSTLTEEKKDKKINENKRLVSECKEKMETYEDELLDLPKMIDETNRKLMLITMQSCYETINANAEDIKEISEWVASVRVELKKKLIRKQKKEIINREMYSYMHNIFGAEVIELFDLQYMMDHLNKDRNKEKIKENKENKEKK